MTHACPHQLKKCISAIAEAGLMSVAEDGIGPKEGLVNYHVSTLILSIDISILSTLPVWAIFERTALVGIAQTKPRQGFFLPFPSEQGCEPGEIFESSPSRPDGHQR